MQKSNLKYVGLIILVSLCCLFGMNFLLQIDLQNIIYPDSLGYHEAAKNLYIFARGHNYRPMLLAAIHGFPYLLGGNDSTIYQVSFYLNLMCWLGFAIALFLVDRKSVV